MSNEQNKPVSPNQSESLLDRIDRVPGVCGGRPKIKGTRWAVDVMVDMIAGGESMEYLLREFPKLDKLDWEAAIAFSSRT